MKEDISIVSAAVFLFGLGLVLGLILVQVSGIKSNKPIKPEIQIICKGLECDTTYTYKAF